jgi:hypothetical protein
MQFSVKKDWMSSLVLSCGAMSWLAGESVRRGNEEKYVNNANSLRAAPF